MYYDYCWIRYDDSDSKIIYDSTWSHSESTQWYNGTASETNTIDGSVTFKIFATKLRLVQTLHAGIYNQYFSIYIDGIKDCDLYYNNVGVTSPMTVTPNVLIYEKLNLSNSIHTIKIICQSNSGGINFDAIDINDSGRLLPFDYDKSITLENQQWI